MDHSVSLIVTFSPRRSLHFRLYSNCLIPSQGEQLFHFHKLVSNHLVKKNRIIIIMVVQRFSRSLLRQANQFAVKQLPSLASTRYLSSSPWSQFEMAPVDPIVGLNEIYQKDDFPQKVIVGVGAYRDDKGKPYVLPCVREAEQIVMDKNLDMEYTGIVSTMFYAFIHWDV